MECGDDRILDVDWQAAHECEGNLEIMQTYDGLKEEWLKYERGLASVELDEEFHPLWNCFINWMVNFDAKRRPNFAQ